MHGRSNAAGLAPWAARLCGRRSLRWRSSPAGTTRSWPGSGPLRARGAAGGGACCSTARAWWTRRCAPACGRIRRSSPAPALEGGDGAAADLAGRLEAAGASIMAASEPVLAAVSPVRSPSGVVALTHHHPLDAAPRFRRGRSGAGGGGRAGPGQSRRPSSAPPMPRAAAACSSPTGRPDPFGWKALRGAMGSTFRLPVVDAGAAARGHRRGAGARRGRAGGGAARRRPAARMRPARIVARADRRRKGGGLPGGTSELADACVSVPMRPGVESLNAAVAAALVAYEARRQRTGAEAGK